MALAGVGVDLLEIARMERACARHPRFTSRVFTESERAYCDARPKPAEHYAACFAAREAVAKALGTGFTQGVTWGNISVTHDESGRPHAVLTGRAAEVAARQGVREIALSLTHTHDVAVANAVAVTDDVRPVVEKADDTKSEMTASFKEARSILDELERLQTNTLAGQDKAHG